MNLLLQDYLSERLQSHFDALSLPQTDRLLEHKFHEKELVLDTFAASVYGVSVTQIRQTISRKRYGFSEEQAFHLTYEEHKEWYRKYINPPKIHKSDYLPYAITFEGFCLLSMRLTSPIATKVHLGIIETISAKNSVNEKRRT